MEWRREIESASDPRSVHIDYASSAGTMAFCIAQLRLKDAEIALDIGKTKSLELVTVAEQLTDD